MTTNEATLTGVLCSIAFIVITVVIINVRYKMKKRKKILKKTVLQMEH